MNPTWNRRTFLTSLGLTTAAATLPAESVVTTGEPTSAPPSSGPHLAFVSHARFGHGGRGGIVTFRVDRGEWTELSPFWPTHHAHALVGHPTLPLLYIAGKPSVHDANQRQGHATAVSMDRDHPMTPNTDGSFGQHWLTQLQRHRLPLDATWPSDVAVSPDGRRLLVSDFEGGLYSVFPIATDGSLEPVEHVLKLTGNAVDTAHPDGLLFHPSGRLAYSADRGTHQLHVISFDQPQPVITARFSFAPHSYPNHLALHPSGRFLLVTQRSGILSVLPIDQSSGTLLGGATHHRVVTTNGVETLSSTPQAIASMSSPAGPPRRAIANPASPGPSTPIACPAAASPSGCIACPSQISGQSPAPRCTTAASSSSEKTASSPPPSIHAPACPPNHAMWQSAANIPASSSVRCSCSEK